MPCPVFTETPGLGQESLSSHHLHRELLLQQRLLLCQQPRLLLLRPQPRRLLLHQQPKLLLLHQQPRLLLLRQLQLLLHRRLILALPLLLSNYVTKHSETLPGEMLWVTAFYFLVVGMPIVVQGAEGDMPVPVARSALAQHMTVASMLKFFLDLALARWVAPPASQLHQGLLHLDH